MSTVGLPVKILKALLPSSILATCPVHLNLVDWTNDMQCINVITSFSPILSPIEEWECASLYFNLPSPLNWKYGLFHSTSGLSPKCQQPSLLDQDRLSTPLIMLDGMFLCHISGSDLMLSGTTRTGRYRTNPSIQRLAVWMRFNLSERKLLLTWLFLKTECLMEVCLFCLFTLVGTYLR